MGAHSDRKGKKGELELAKFLREHGYPSARRGQQHAGGGDSPDVVCDELPGLHLECKRTERFRLYEAMAQAQRDAPARRVPIVAHRMNRREWVAVVPLADFLLLYGYAKIGHEELLGEPMEGDDEVSS